MASEYTQSILLSASELINLKPGYPAPCSIPIASINKSAVSLLGNMTDPNFYMYGVGLGYNSCRKDLAEFVSKNCNVKIDWEEIMITNGSSGGLDLVCKKCMREGDIVFTEDPTYFLVRQAFNDYHLKIISVPMENDGVNVAELERLAQLHKPKLFYTIPIGHNPTGITTCKAKREKVVSLAYKHGFKIVADEVYQLLSFPGCVVPPPYATFDYDKECVVSLHSFSKIMSPALRLGWIQAGKKILEHLATAGIIRSGGGLNPLVSGIVHEAIKNGSLQSAIDSSRQLLQSKMKAMGEAIDANFGSSVTWIPPEAGYFITIRLPEWATARDLLVECERFNVNFLPGDEFGSECCKNQVRLSFSYYTADEIALGVKYLASGFNSLKEKQGPHK